jgi:hypothetical protein
LAVLASNKAVPARFETKSTHRQKPAIAGFFYPITFDGEMPLLMARRRTATEPAAFLRQRFMPITGKD